MRKKFLFLVVLFVSILGISETKVYADDMTYNNKDSIGFVGKYEPNERIKSNGNQNLTSSEREQVNGVIPRAGDSSNILYFIFLVGIAYLIILSTRRLFKTEKHNTIKLS